MDQVLCHFIDLKKAYNSVPRNAMWLALEKLCVLEDTIDLIHSFHQGMKARVRLDGALLEEFSMENGLRQGCCMALVLFNLYTCVILERWKARVEGVDGVGINLKYKYDYMLFRRNTRNAAEIKLTECFFADDGTLLAGTRSGAERALQVYQATSTDFGFTMSISKTRHMVARTETADSDTTPIPVSGGEMTSVDEFPYLGSVVAASGVGWMRMWRRE